MDNWKLYNSNLVKQFITFYNTFDFNQVRTHSKLAITTYISEKQMFYKLPFQTGHHAYKSSWTPAMNAKPFGKEDKSTKVTDYNQFAVGIFKPMDHNTLMLVRNLPSFSTFKKRTRTIFCLHILLRRGVEKLDWWCLAVTEPSQKIKEAN